MDISQNRKLFIFEGILFLLIGIAAIAVPGFFTLSIELVLGWLLIIGGAYQLFRSWSGRHQPGFIWSVFFALLNIVLGVLLLAKPIVGIISLTIILITYFIIAGLYQIFWSTQITRMHGWWLLLINGLLSLAMAAILVAGWPDSAIWAIGLLFGINMLFTGCALLSLAWNAHSGKPVGQ
ncbi:MAG: DUF308 domain-containing protein [Parachlamydiales bacterium]|jgi:uncharacterized membrane protein HdeD (DUF308 family)